MYEIKWEMRDWATRFCLWIVSKVNRFKDRELAYVLLEMSKDYDPKDTRRGPSPPF